MSVPPENRIDDPIEMGKNVSSDARDNTLDNVVLVCFPKQSIITYRLKANNRAKGKTRLQTCKAWNNTSRSCSKG